MRRSCPQKSFRVWNGCFIASIGLDYIFVLPIYLLVQRLRGRPLRFEKPVILAITPR